MSSKNKNKQDGAESVNETSTSETTTENAVVEVKENQYILESGLPIPAPQRSKHKYPFKIMQPGQSFPISKKTSAASVQIAYWKKQLPGFDYTVRALQKEEIEVLKTKGVFGAEVTEGSRIWRTDGMVEAGR